MSDGLFVFAISNTKMPFVVYSKVVVSAQLFLESPSSFYISIIQEHRMIEREPL